ncbi:MAG: hypothetical protein L3J29_03145 [Cyclobacteriaceae bacterium]|nr:hypothetical protein [Cyclobacteriaceae bacterium]
MKNFKLSYLYLIALVIITSACKKEEEVPRGEYASGVIVVNEGNFFDADGGFGFYDPASSEATQDIYQKVNNEIISGTFQSMHTFDGKSYLIDQAGHKIVVVEAETFKYVATINSGLNTPRYMAITNGKGYVSNWGTYNAVTYTYSDPFIAVLNLDNFSVEKTLNSEAGVEGMIALGFKVYVASSGTNKVQVIDSETDEFVDGISVANGPRLFAEDGNGRLWVLCNDYVTSSLSKIDFASNKVTSFEIAGSAKSISANGDGSSIYYSCNPYQAPAQIFKIGNDATFAPQEAFITGENFYGLGVNPTDETIYVGRSNGANNGTVIRYNTDGTELDNFASGRFPNGFEFRK